MDSKSQQHIPFPASHANEQPQCPGPMPYSQQENGQPFSPPVKADQPPPYSYSYPYAVQPLSREGPNTAAPRIWFQVGKDAVRNLSTDQEVIHISRSVASGIPKEIGGRPLLTLSRGDSSILGTIRYHSVSTSAIDYSVNARPSKLKDYGCFTSKYEFKSISREGEKWRWKMEDETNGVLLNAKEGGQELAKIENGSLVIENTVMSAAEYDEALVTGIAVAEKARRAKEGEGVVGVIEEAAEWVFG